MGEGESSGLCPEPHNSICHRFCPDLGIEGLPEVERERLPVLWRVGLEDFP